LQNPHPHRQQSQTLTPNKSLKAEAKRPQDTIKEDSEKKLSDYVDPWDEVEPYMSDSETPIFEPAGTMSAEDEKLFLERFCEDF